MSTLLAWSLFAGGAMCGAMWSGVVEEGATVVGAEVCGPDFGIGLPWTLELDGVDVEAARLPGVSRDTTAAHVSGTDEACDGAVERQLTCRLRSLESVTRTAGGGVPLRLEIAISDFPAGCSAEASLKATLAAASPDTGLSYGWDVLLLAGSRLARLHAECSWSEEWFSALAGEVERRFVLSGSRVARKVLCRCGGGCKEVETEPPGTEGLERMDR